MLHKMYHRIVDFWFTSILGVFGYGLAQVNIHLSDTALKLLVSMFTAMAAGGMGYVGKLAAVWSIRKIRTIIHSKTKK